MKNTSLCLKENFKKKNLLEYPRLHDSDKISIFFFWRGGVCKSCFDFRSSETYWVNL